MNVAFAIPPSQLYLWGGTALAGLALMGLILRALERRRAKRLERFVERRLAPRLLSGVDDRMRRPLPWLTMVGAAALVLALMQPHWGQSYENVTRRSHDILICLDTSESMLAENPLPNRLERAKQKIASILDRSFGDRFGLVAFSGAAELMCPLTLDHGYYRTILGAVNTNSIGLEGTDIAAALEVATAVFRDQVEETGKNPRNSRAIVLISDGEQLSGDAIAAANAASQFARVHVIGVGDPRGAEVKYSGAFARQPRGAPALEPHVSKLDEPSLTRIAQQGRGGYIRSTPDNRDIDEMYGLIQQLFARDVEGDVRQQLVNRFQWPLAIAVFCFAVEGLWLVFLPWLRKWQDRRARANQGEHSYA